jgi:hypothetical protein
MHSAPAVRYPVPRSTRAGRLLAALCVLPSVPLLLWWGDGAQPVAMAVFAVAWACAAGLAGLQWRAMAAGQLRWDGQAWWWLPDEAAAHDEYPVSVALRLDLQMTALVRVDGTPGWAGGWRVLERSAAPARWNDMRRALYEPVRAAALSPHPQP